MVKLITTYSSHSDVQSALNALVDPAVAAEAERHLRARLEPLLQRQTVLSCDRPVPPANRTTAAVLAAIMTRLLAAVTTVRAIEVEVPDEAETPSTQQHTPSKSKAAALLIRAGAQVEDEAAAGLKDLALTEGNEELRQLLRGCAASSGPSWQAVAWQSS
jgi:hypothetical protein